MQQLALQFGPRELLQLIGLFGLFGLIGLIDKFERMVAVVGDRPAG